MNKPLSTTSSVIRVGFSIAAILLLLGTRVNAEESLAVARDLYSAAAYEDALIVLERIDKSTTKPGDRLALHQYRAFCLLALGRTADAERAIEVVLSTEPLYRPSDTETSPRLRSAFAMVRQRMLPAIVQRKYLQAKGAFDAGDFFAAAKGFNQVLDVLADPDFGPAAHNPPLSDLGTLARGFRELSVRAAMPAPAVPEKREAPTAAMVEPRVFNTSDSNVVPPVVIRQDLPPYPKNIGMLRSGLLEVVINEVGLVETASFRSPIHARYDALALAATKSWRYKPATLTGKPVRFRKFIFVSLKQNN
jgi:hypothetical protein